MCVCVWRLMHRIDVCTTHGFENEVAKMMNSECWEGVFPPVDKIGCDVKYSSCRLE